MNETHIVEKVNVRGKELYMVVDGVPYTIDLSAQSQQLREAPSETLGNIEVSSSGYGLHWPDIDEDLSVDGLIGIKHDAPLAVAEAGEKYGV